MIPVMEAMEVQAEASPVRARPRPSERAAQTLPISRSANGLSVAIMGEDMA